MNSAGETPRCSECGSAVLHHDAIQFESLWICASCKPRFEQKLREGSVPAATSKLRYGGFWIRAGATTIDALIHYTFGTVLGVICGQTLAEATGLDGAEELTPLDWALLMAGTGFDLVYSTVLVGRFGGTVGKMVFGLRVVAPNGERISYRRALARCLASYISMLPCFAGFVLAAFDREKRSLHDHICNTRVIHVRRSKA